MMINSKYLTADQKIEAMLQEILIRVNDLEEEIKVLRKPLLMYRRPGSDEYERVTDYLDDVERRLEFLYSKESSMD